MKLCDLTENEFQNKTYNSTKTQIAFLKNKLIALKKERDSTDIEANNTFQYYHDIYSHNPNKNDSYWFESKECKDLYNSKIYKKRAAIDSVVAKINAKINALIIPRRK
jgi:hypothetical protein